MRLPPGYEVIRINTAVLKSAQWEPTSKNNSQPKDPETMHRFFISLTEIILHFCNEYVPRSKRSWTFWHYLLQHESLVCTILTKVSVPPSDLASFCNNLGMTIHPETLHRVVSAIRKRTLYEQKWETQWTPSIINQWRKCCCRWRSHAKITAQNWKCLRTL